MPIDFSAIFDRVNHQGIFYMLCSVGIVGSVLSILTQILSNRFQHVMVDGCQSKLGNIVSGSSAAGKCFGPLLFLVFNPELFSILEKSLLVMPTT